MARPLRVEFPGACYHVINRNRRRGTCGHVFQGRCKAFLVEDESAREITKRRLRDPGRCEVD